MVVFLTATVSKLAAIVGAFRLGGRSRTHSRSAIRKGRSSSRSSGISTNFIALGCKGRVGSPKVESLEYLRQEKYRWKYPS